MACVNSVKFNLGCPVIGLSELSHAVMAVWNCSCQGHVACRSAIFTTWALTGGLAGSVIQKSTAKFFLPLVVLHSFTPAWSFPGEDQRSVVKLPMIKGGFVRVFPSSTAPQPHTCLAAAFCVLLASSEVEKEAGVAGTRANAWECLAHVFGLARTSWL